MEKAEWKPFRNALDKSERREFDDMFDIPRLYLSACSNSVQLVPLHPIIMSILFHHYKELKECMKRVEETLEAKSTSWKKKEGILTIKKEEQKTKKYLLTWISTFRIAKLLILKLQIYNEKTDFYILA